MAMAPVLAAVPVLGRALCMETAVPTEAVTGRVLLVGSQRAVRTLREASRLAKNGDTLELDPEEFRADVAAWPQSDLTIRCRSGQATLIAAGAHVEGKGTFVSRGTRQFFEGLSFIGSRVPDRNGAGIRIERGEVSISNCHFEDNENGILAGNDGATTVEIHDSTFVNNGSGNGLTHNLYVGTIARLAVVGCYLARSRIGHLLKSRAAETLVAYSRLSSEDGASSYELEVPNGGNASVIGNLIQQGERSENFAIISYGAESYRNSNNRLTIAFTTLVNERGRGGVFVVARTGADKVAINDCLLVGRGSFEVAAPLDRRGVHEAGVDEFVDPARFDYRLRASSRLVGASGLRGAHRGELPCREYVHPGRSELLEIASPLSPLSPGAFQRVGPASR